MSSMAEGEQAGKALEGLAHVQAAALEMIKAARAFLDVAEDLVRDPGTAAAVTSTVANVARAVAKGATPSGQAADGDGPTVERIKVT